MERRVVLAFVGRSVGCVFPKQRFYSDTSLVCFVVCPILRAALPRPEDTWLASPLNTKQNSVAERAASSAAFTSLTFTATPTLPWLSRARAQTVTALGSFSRVPLEPLPSPWLPGVATSPLHPSSSHTGRRQRCENAGDQGLGLQGNPDRHPQECQIPARKQ